MKKIIAVFAVLAVFLAVPMAFADNTRSVNATVSIPGTCGITVNPSSMNFGSVQTGQVSNESSTTLYNEGSTPANVTIFGVDWTYSSYFFDTTYTHYSKIQGQNYDDMYELQETPGSSLGALNNNATMPVYLRVKIPFGQQTGSYVQTITFTSAC